ncbi:MAG: EAL domain-containing protein [Pseudogulbenkiania sp.]|nr:EAL domain-containing protein [Pseudogulbenkiania sp.]
MTETQASLEAELARLHKRLKREASARQEAESIAERGLRELYQRQQEIELLEAIAVAANEAVGVDEVMAFAVREICRYTQWPVGHVLYADCQKSPSCMVSANIWHCSDTQRFATFQVLSSGLEFGTGVGLPGRILESSKPAWIMDVRADPNFPRAPQARLVGLKAAFGFPVLVGAEVVSVLEFFAEESLQPDGRLLKIMGQIGTQLGRVIERQRARERLLHDAFHDPLTQLANRALFLDRLHITLSRFKRNKNYQFAVLFLDLDRFKVVNDSLGHLAGDQLLVQVAQRLRACLRSTDVVAHLKADDESERWAWDECIAHLGGDEFTIILDDIRDASAPIRVAERIQYELVTPFDVDGQAVYSTVSIGIALSSTGYAVEEDILRDAAPAMYRAKTLGRSRWAMFDQMMHNQAVACLQLEADLHRAVREQEFRLFYQPIVSLGDGVVRGFEALIRWVHPRLGLVSPAEFIGLAEEIGLIRDIGDWVLQEACRQLSEWQRAFPSEPPLTMSVNISARQLNQANLVGRVAKIVQSSCIAPGSLKLELTESVVMSDAERSCQLFQELKGLGIQLSLDDFGTGYSSLSYLRRLPLDVLKVDRSFVSHMDVDEEKQNITQIIVLLARTLGLTVIAEGAETEGEVKQLRELGCDYVQGYYFHRPMPANSAKLVLQEQLERLSVGQA